MEHLANIWSFEKHNQTLVLSNDLDFRDVLNPKHAQLCQINHAFFLHQKGEELSFGYFNMAFQFQIDAFKRIVVQEIQPNGTNIEGTKAQLLLYLGYIDFHIDSSQNTIDNEPALGKDPETDKDLTNAIEKLRDLKQSLVTRYRPYLIGIQGLEVKKDIAKLNNIQTVLTVHKLGIITFLKEKYSSELSTNDSMAHILSLFLPSSQVTIRRNLDDMGKSIGNDPYRNKKNELAVIEELSKVGIKEMGK